MGNIIGFKVRLIELKRTWTSQVRFNPLNYCESGDIGKCKVRFNLVNYCKNSESESYISRS